MSSHAVYSTGSESNAEAYGCEIAFLITPEATGDEVLDAEESKKSGPQEAMKLTNAWLQALPGVRVLLDHRAGWQVQAEPRAVRVRFDEKSISDLVVAFESGKTQPFLSEWLSALKTQLNLVEHNISLHKAVVPPRQETLASRLKDKSNLDIGTLCRILDVSRATFHKWLNGVEPRKEHSVGLLNVLALVEEGLERLNPLEFTQWLKSPVHGESTLDLLARKDWNAARGRLYRSPIERRLTRRIQPRFGQGLSRKEWEDSVEGITTRAWNEEP